MPKANLTQYAVLGLLDAGPKTGYDVKSFVEKAMDHFWSESYRWIYTTLDELEADGLAAGRADARGGRERVVYRITKKGERALRSWLAEPPAAAKVRDEMLLKVLFGQGSARTIGRHIKAHQDAMVERHRKLAELEAELPELDVGRIGRRNLGLTLSLGRRLAAAHLKWCEEAMAALKTAAGPRKKARRAR